MTKTYLCKLLFIMFLCVFGIVPVFGIYSGSGTFTKLAALADVSDGYYVIAYGNTFAMSNANASSYFGNVLIAPANNIILNPSSTIVWDIRSHIDGGRTIFNEATQKYVSYSGSANSAFAVTTVSGGSERWNFAYTSNLFTITNFSFTSRLLQYNISSPRFACYTGSQQNVTLYKLDAVASPPIVSPASLTGAVDAAFSFGIAASNSPSSYSIASGTLPTGLSLNANTGIISGIPTFSGFSSLTVTATNASGTSLAATLSFDIAKGNQIITFNPLVVKSTADLSFELGATASSGLAVSYSSSNQLVATVTGNVISIIGVGAAIITANQAGNLNYFAAAPINQNLTVNQYIAPQFSMWETTPTTQAASIGSDDLQTIYVAGINLTADVKLSITGANANQFNISQGTLTQTNGNAPNTLIGISYTPTTIGNHTAVLTFSSSGAIDVSRALTGTAVLPMPIAVSATNVTSTGFTANWNALPGATEYLLALHSISSSAPVTKIEGFAVAPLAPEGWLFSSISSIYGSVGNYGVASPAVKFDGSGCSLTSPLLPSAASEMSFWMKGQTSTSSSMLVEGNNGTAWVQIDNVVTPSNTAKTYLYTANSIPSLPANIKQFRYSYTKVTSNVAFDDVSYTYGGQVALPIVGSPFSINGVQNKVFTGLNAASDYYYSIIAKIGNQTTVSSNEILVKTLSTGFNQFYVPLDIIAVMGKLKFSSVGNEKVDVFTLLGQKLLSTLAVEGENVIELHEHGVFIIKVGNRMAKVIM